MIAIMDYSGLMVAPISTGATTGANIEGSASLQLTVGESPTGINVSKCVSGKFAVGGKACVGVSNTGKPFVTLGIGSGFGGGTSASVRWTEEYKWSDITRGDK